MPKQRNAPTSLPMQYRMVEASFARVARAADAAADAPNLYELTFSSEAEVERWYGMEVLSHESGAVDFSRLRSGGAVLIDHYSDQVGVVRSASLKEKRGSAMVQFSRSQRGQEIEQDVTDGIRQNVSVGYHVKEMEKTSERDGVSTYTVTRWQPVEVSIVSVPADYSVGIGRGREAGEEFPVSIRGVKPEKESVMKKVREANGTIIEVADDDPREAVRETEASAPGVSAREIARQAVEAERERQTLIEDLCERNGMSADFTRKMVRGGRPVGEIGGLILDAKAAEREARGDESQPHAESMQSLGLSAKDAEKYSFARAILVAAGIERGGVEAECSAVLERMVPMGCEKRGGFYLPWRIRDAQRVTRALTTSGVGKGAETIVEQQGEFIELLRNAAKLVALGARTLTGLTAPINFTKQTGAMTASWVGENPGSDVASSDVALALAQLSPKTLQATTAYSRQFVVQSALDAESFIRSDLSKITALNIDKAGIHGLGAGGEPTGIYKAVGVGAKAMGGTADYGKLIDMVSTVAGVNALLNSPAFITHPTVAGNLMKLARFSNTDSPVWSDSGTIDDSRVLGYRAVSTNQVSNTMTGSDVTGGSNFGLIFGDFDSLIIGGFAGNEIIVDPYALKKRGMIELTMFTMVDILTRHGESFCKATGMTG